MKHRISRKLKRQISERAQLRCEYCRVHEHDSFLPFEIDHIVSVKHGGGNELSNLAYACPHCNQHKGTDLTTFLENYSDVATLFNPRTHHWNEHFLIENGEIISLTRTGQATVKLLRFNEPERLIFRQALAAIGRYP